MQRLPPQYYSDSGLTLGQTQAIVADTYEVRIITFISMSVLRSLSVMVHSSDDLDYIHAIHFR